VAHPKGDELGRGGGKISMCSDNRDKLPWEDLLLCSIITRSPLTASLEHSGTKPYHQWGQKAEKKGKVFAFGKLNGRGWLACSCIDTADKRAWLFSEERADDAARQGQCREGFCGFPACQAESAVLQGRGELGSTDGLL